MNMELVKSKVSFDRNKHVYTLKGKELIGVTPIVAWMFPETYSGISDDVLSLAKERGTRIHELCEVADSLGIDESSEPEVNDYLALCRNNALECHVSEYLVSDGKDIASCIDKVYTDNSIADIKTTSSIHTGNVTLQLSIYAYLMEKQNKGFEVNKLYVIWLPKPQYGSPKLMELQRIDSKTIKSIIKTYIAARQKAVDENRIDEKGNFIDEERTNEQFLPLFDTIMAAAPYDLPANITKSTERLRKLDMAISKLQEMKEQQLATMLEYMKAGGYKKMENDILSVTYLAPSTSVRIDSDKLKKTHPDIFMECSKEVKTKEQIRIKFKNGN
jgi:hypothetical protein